MGDDAGEEHREAERIGAALLSSSRSAVSRLSAHRLLLLHQRRRAQAAAITHGSAAVDEESHRVKPSRASAADLLHIDH